MKGFKHLMILMFVLIGSIFAAGIASADMVPVQLEKIWIDGVELQWWDDFTVLDLEKGQDLEIKVKLTALDDSEDVQVEASLKGFEYDDKYDTEDTTHVFDVEEDVTYIKTLNIEVPDKMENDEYQLRVEITNRNDDKDSYTFTIKINSERHNLQIKDIDFTPSTGVEAGKGFLTKVRIENIGQKDEESIKVTVAVPDLGISGSDYIDSIEADDTESSEEIWLRIPKCAESGFYQAVVTVSYDEMYETVHATKTFAVTGDVCNVPVEVDAVEDENNSDNEFVVDMTEDNEEDDKDMLRNALEIGLIGLLVALVILGLVAGIVALSRKKDF